MTPVVATSRSLNNTETSPSATPTSAASLASLSEYHLDYSQWDPSDTTSDSSQSFVRALRRAMVGIGFFYLHNTPLDSGSNRRSSIFSLTERFFQLPLQDRLSIDMDNSRHFRGYCKFGDERTQSLQDHRDQIDYGTHVKPIAVDEAVLRSRPYLNLYGPNQFLDDDILPGHKDIMLDWFDTANEISMQLTRALELALGVREAQLSQFLTGVQSPVDGEQKDSLGPLPYARMKTIRYPAGEVVDGIKRVDGSEQGVGAHKDSGWLTLLSTSSVGGLQVQDFEGNWLSVPHVEGSTIVNFGQQIENVSGGIIQSATHRVVFPAVSPEPRYSMAWFSFPALNARLKPLDALQDFNDEVINLWKEAEARRQGKEIICDVPKGDLFGTHTENFGWIAFRGLVRSHPGVVKQFYTDFVE
ncbi:hypothetical protein BG011_009289 [Mortierella polycephala]|uniref:Fe2OG dioxygenase domain-containing protein n=1 Tax=Mortierella polycephala TaxID=41804 RepID=A0A9P6QDA6_9FUNG|nr:hypothetical protein BG011_009289 [Mortierella polycephala]